MSFAERTTKSIIDNLRISSVDDLFLLDQIIWQRGAIIVNEHLDGAEASLLIKRPISIITISDTILYSKRRRFSIAHEFGHLEMHKSKSPMFFCSNDDINYGEEQKRSNKVLEEEANLFASSFLMPGKFFAPLVLNESIGISTIIELSEKFDTSVTATGIRYVNISNEPLILVMSDDERIKWFVANSEFSNLNLFVDVRNRISMKSAAYNVKNAKMRTPMSKQVPLSAWLREGRYNKKATLYESSLYLENHNSIISLLWINEIIDDDWIY